MDVMPPCFACQGTAESELQGTGLLNIAGEKIGGSGTLGHSIFIRFFRKDGEKMAEMRYIRRALPCDLSRIAEIEIFNYRLYFYPIFQQDAYYFKELQVPEKIKEYESRMGSLWVYDDGAVKGFMLVQEDELVKLFVEPVLHSRGIGTALLRYAVDVLQARYLWALEKNERAIAFYQRQGFRKTSDRMPEEDTEEYLIRLER